ncbi:hypothetical protein PSD17_27080 [Pseudonocardia sp. D17]|nr:hypothetical protein PSD17_27080 [Pseudonocardia sp. D17]
MASDRADAAVASRVRQRQGARRVEAPRGSRRLTGSKRPAASGRTRYRSRAGPAAFVAAEARAGRAGGDGVPHPA